MSINLVWRTDVHLSDRAPSSRTDDWADAVFDKLGQECAACNEPYDKKSKEHAMTWKVVVREKEEVVRLYCPTCWNAAKQVIEDYKIQTGE